MKISEISSMIPRLGNHDRDIESWAEEFQRIMELANIEEPKRIFAWAKECVQGRLKGILEDLKTIDGDDVTYPNINEMKTAIEDYLEVTQQEKCFNLKALKIRRNETIRDFNWRYNNLHNSLNPESQEFITIKDYCNSISSRPFARTQVITAQPDTLEEALQIAELAENATEAPNIPNNIIMALGNENNSFQYNPYYMPNSSPFNFLHNNPYYDTFDNNINPVLYTNNKSFNIPNNNGNMNYRYNRKYNNYYNTYSNLYNNNEYNNRFNHGLNNNNSQYDPYNNYYNNNFNNFDSYYRNNFNNNYLKNDNNLNKINNFNNTRYNSNSNNNINNERFLTNNVNNDRNLNKQAKNNNYNNVNNNNYINNNSKTLKCFKCNQFGHKLQDCPYSYRELAIMEEEGKLSINNINNNNKPLN